jgi:hypothetical protein
MRALQDPARPGSNGELTFQKGNGEQCEKIIARMGMLGITFLMIRRGPRPIGGGRMGLPVFATSINFLCFPLPFGMEKIPF